uniref:Uncharacterized protein n=1 Tax=Timema tahoe TaxID=61484 RepID=A0A7R9NVQ9_9NEOP|nr:unnamed protein product [Timema tahoe]
MSVGMAHTLADGSPEHPNLHTFVMTYRGIIPAPMSFTNCTCLPFTQDTTLSSGLSSSLTTQHPLYAKDLSAVMTNGPCPVDCTRILYTYILVGFFIQALSSSGRIGNVLVNFRCVKQKDKVFAQGLSLLLVSLFAFIPGPILFGAMIVSSAVIETAPSLIFEYHPDYVHSERWLPACWLLALVASAGCWCWLTLVTLSQYKVEAYSSCLLWDASCGEKGNCWLYQKDKFRIYMNVTAAVLTSLGVILDIKVWHLGKTLDLYGDTDELSSDDRRRSSAYRSRQVSLANRSRQSSLANRSRQPSIADRSRQGSVSDRSRRPSFVDSSGRPSLQNSRQPSLIMPITMTRCLASFHPPRAVQLSRPVYELPCCAQQVRRDMPTEGS